MKLLYSDYGINSTSKLPLKNITRLLIDSVKLDQEEKLWNQWLVDYSRMSGETFVSFADYKEKTIHKSENKTILNKEEILKDAEEARRLVEEGR